MTVGRAKFVALQVVRQATLALLTEHSAPVTELLTQDIVLKAKVAAPEMAIPRPRLRLLRPVPALPRRLERPAVSEVTVPALAQLKFVLYNLQLPAVEPNQTAVA